MEKLYFSEVAGALGLEAKEDFEITSITTDSREITKGALFVALKGERFDGADFVLEALGKGAAAAVCEKAFDDQRVLTVENALEALGVLAAWYRRRFSILSVAITGSVGKTTTKQLIASVLSEKYNTLYTQGNLNNEIGLPLTVFKLDETHEAAVFELGMSGFGEIEKLSKIASPDIAVITNVGVAHIEKLGSRENIAKAKLEMLRGLKKNGTIIINGDEPLLTEAAASDSRTKITFGLENKECDYLADSIFELDGETDFVIRKKSGTIAANISTIGLHNVYNALAAAAVGEAAGLSDLEIVKGLAAFENTGARQNIYDLGDIRLIDDTYNANPDSMRAALSVLKTFNAGKRIAVLADMLELGDYSGESHYDIGRLAADCCDMLLVFGLHAAEYIRGAKDAGMADRALQLPDPQSIAEKLAVTAYEGDTILFKGSRGMKVERVIDALVKEWQK